MPFALRKDIPKSPPEIRGFAWWDGARFVEDMGEAKAYPTREAAEADRDAAQHHSYPPVIVVELPSS